MISVAKLMLLLTALVSAFVGFKHVGVRFGLKSLLRGGMGESKRDISSCKACLGAGKDFCIADSMCIPRATRQCKGPHDHITGDKEFALYGNPHHQHSMVCPNDPAVARAPPQNPSVQKSTSMPEIDVKSLPWCTMAKTRCMQNGKKLLEGRCADAWEKCEIKWEADHNIEEKKDVDTKDCYFDKECHYKVDWTQIAKLKEGIFGRLKLWKEQQNRNAVREMMPKVHRMFADAGMPNDRIDYTIVKWVKFIYPDALEGMPMPEQANVWPMCTIAKSRCMKDGEKMMDGDCAGAWEKCEIEWKTHKGKMDKKAEWPMCTMAKTECMEDGEKVLKGRCGKVWGKCLSEWEVHKGTKDKRRMDKIVV